LTLCSGVGRRSPWRLFKWDVHFLVALMLFSNLLCHIVFFPVSKVRVEVEGEYTDMVGEGHAA